MQIRGEKPLKGLLNAVGDMKNRGETFWSAILNTTCSPYLFPQNVEPLKLSGLKWDIVRNIMITVIVCWDGEMVVIPVLLAMEVFPHGSDG